MCIMYHEKLKSEEYMRKTPPVEVMALLQKFGSKDEFSDLYLPESLKIRQK